MPLPAASGAAAEAEGDAAHHSSAADPAKPSLLTPSRLQRPAVPAISAAALAELRALQVSRLTPPSLVFETVCSEPHRLASRSSS